MREFTRLRPPFIIRLSLVPHAGRWHTTDRTAVALFPHDPEGRGRKDEEEIHNRNDLRCVNQTRRGVGRRETAPDRRTVNVRN